MHLVQTLEAAPCPAGDDNIQINSQQVLNSCFVKSFYRYNPSIKFSLTELLPRSE